MKPTIIIYSRCHYEEIIPTDTLFCFKNYYLPSISNQKYKDFNVEILSNDNKENNNVLQQTIDEYGISNIKIININNRKKYKYDIEINIDIDDSVMPEFIEEIINQYNTINIDTFLIVFYYLKYNIYSKKVYSPFAPSKENRGFPTPFFAIVQKKEKIFEWGCRKHNELDEVIKEVKTITKQICIMNIHNSNAANKLYNEESK
jgi:hypothetical protein